MTKTQKIVKLVEQEGMSVSDAARKLKMRPGLYYAYRHRNKKTNVNVHHVAAEHIEQHRKLLGETPEAMIRIPVKVFEKLLRGLA